MAGRSVTLAAVERPAYSAHHLLLAVCPPTFTVMVSALALSPFLAVLAVDLHTNVSLLGQVPAVMNGLAAALGLVVGPLADRFGQRRILLAGTLAVVVGGLIIAGTPAVGGLFLAAVFGAASRAVVVSLSYAVLSSRLSGDVARQALSWVVTTMGIAVLLGPPIMTTLGTWLGWRGAFVALAGAGGLTAWLLVRMLDGDGPSATQVDLRGVLASYAPVVRRRAVLGLYGGGLLRNTVAWSIGIYMGAYLVERRAFSLQEVGLAFGVAGVGQVAGGYVFGGHTGGIPLRSLLAGLYLLEGALLAAFLIFPLDRWWAMAILGLAFSLNAGGDVLETTLIARDTHGGQATTMALYGTAKSVGTALAGTLGGLLILFGGYASLGLALPLVAVGGALLVGALQTPPQAAVPAQAPAS